MFILGIHSYVHTKILSTKLIFEQFITKKKNEVVSTQFGISQLSHYTCPQSLTFCASTEIHSEGTFRSKPVLLVAVSEVKFTGTTAGRESTPHIFTNL